MMLIYLPIGECDLCFNNEICEDYKFADTKVCKEFIFEEDKWLLNEEDQLKLLEQK